MNWGRGYLFFQITSLGKYYLEELYFPWNRKRHLLTGFCSYFLRHNHVGYVVGNSKFVLAQVLLCFSLITWGNGSEKTYGSLLLSRKKNQSSLDSVSGSQLCSWILLFKIRHRASVHRMWAVFIMVHFIHTRVSDHTPWLYCHEIVWAWHTQLPDSLRCYKNLPATWQ